MATVPKIKTRRIGRNLIGRLIGVLSALSIPDHTVRKERD
jgi:hypothetical protein